MKTLEESVVTAMDGADKELFPYLPYILQDIWEIGTDPDTVSELIGKHFRDYEKLKVLDLGCGKGAVSVKVARKFKCHCHGIDAVDEFIQYAQGKAKEYGVEKYCLFETGDIRTAVNHLPQYDIIILGAIGPVLGNYEKSLNTLKNCLKDDGIIIIDDAYIDNNSDFKHPLIVKYDELQRQVKAAGMQIIENLPVAKSEVVESDDIILENLKKRCLELARQHPQKQKLFTDYIKKQEYESYVNAEKVICTTMVVKKSG